MRLRYSCMSVSAFSNLDIVWGLKLWQLGFAVIVVVLGLDILVYEIQTRRRAARDAANQKE